MSRIVPAPIIGQSAASGAQVIDGSLKFDSTKSTHLTRTPSSAGNRKTWTFSCWVKRSEIGSIYPALLSAGSASSDTGFFQITFESDEFSAYMRHSSGTNYYYTNAKLRDISSWYHLVVAMDTTQSAEADRLKMYINGVEPTYRNTSVPSQDQTFLVNNTSLHQIGATKNSSGTTNLFLPGHMSQVYLIDGQALGPENFGFTDPLTNTWKPKKFDIRAEKNPNNGTTWSGQVTGSFYAGSYDQTEMFDGSLSSVAQSTGATWTTNIPFTTLRIYGQIYGAGTRSISVNGTDVTSQLGGNGDARAWHTITGVSSPLTSIQWDGTSYSGATPDLIGLSAIEIDGYVLLDGSVNNSFYLPLDGNSPIGQDKSSQGNDFTPVNFGGSVALDNPQVSGARPALNTTQGGTQAGVGYFGSKENKNITVTVASKTGGGNAYFFDSVERDSLALLRGTTITFDTTDSTNDSHPFKLSSTNADSSGGTEYTDGVAYFVNGSQKSGSDYVSQYSSHSSGFRGIKWTVPHNVSTTYYYCTVHNGMGEGGRLTSTTDETKADPYAWKNVLTLPLVSDANDISNIINLTSSGKSITVSGDTTASSVESNFYNGSHYFDGTGDYLALAADSDFTFGTGDFTIEAWIYSTDPSNYKNFWEGNTTGSLTALRVQIKNSGVIEYVIGSNVRSTGSVIPANKWMHVALTRDSGTVRVFINGNLEQSVTDTTDLTSNQLHIGKTHDNYYYVGYIQDHRTYKGVAKYTSDFVVPSRSPDILPDTPSGVAGGSKLTKIIDGAVSFEGTATSKLTLADSTDFTFGTNDFCIEFYYYNKAFDGTYNIIFDCMGSNRSGIQLAIETDNDYRIEVGDGSNNWIWQSTGFDAKQRKWTHFALTREGSTFRAFEDGVLLGTQTSSTAVGDPRSSAIGGYASDDATNYGFDGFISNFRIVNGSAVYTASFTPSTAPLTNVTNTKLLTCQTATTYQIAAVAPLVSGVNSGTVWSSSLSADSLFRSGYPARDAFNGTTKSSTNDCTATPQTKGQGFTFTFGGGVPFTTLQMQCDHNNGATVTANGVNITSQLSSGSLTNTTITGVSSPLTSLSVVSHNGDAGYLGSVTIDGTMLVDPVAPTDAVSTNFNPFNTDINTVRGQESGYATFNPQDFANSAGSTTLSDGNLKVAFPSDSGTGQAAASLFVSSGKWYCEFYLESVNDLTSVQYGLVSPGSTRNAYIGHSDTLDQYGWEPEIDRAYNNGTNTTPTGKTFTSQWSVAAMALDLDAGTWEMFIDGIPTGTIYSGIKGTYTFAIGDSMSSGYHTHTANFGQKPFKFPPPDGFQPLNTANLRPDKVISRPDQYVGIVTYKGTGTTSQSIRGLNFDAKPDVVWIKDISSSSNYSYRIADSVRGSTKVLFTNATNGTQTNEYGTIDKFAYNGFDLRQGSNNNGDGSNTNGSTLIAWCFKAGGKVGSNAYNIDDVGYGTAAAANMSVGILTTSEYNQTQNWTNNIASATNISSGVEARLFNGILYGTNADIQSTQGSSGVITFTTPITGSRIEIYTLGNVGEIGVNGFDLPISAYTWTDTNVTKLTSVSTRHPGAGQIQNLIAIRVDGKMLVDSGITLNAPSIAPTACSVGTKQGFSIIQYTGTDNTYDTIPHGLTQAPDFALFKNTSQDGDDWIIYHSTLGATKRLKLNTTDQADSQGDQFNNTDPTSNVFTIGTYDNINKDGDSYIAYLWHNVPGLQKFGVYKGADVNGGIGHFVECGFRPALLIVKKHDGGDGGVIMDSEVMKFNPMRRQLRPNETGPYSAEYDSFAVDFYANGFRVIGSTGQMNEYPKNFIFAAWASAPAIDMFGGGGNAR